MERFQTADSSCWALTPAPKLLSGAAGGYGGWEEEGGMDLPPEVVSAAIAQALRALEWRDLNVATLVTAVDEATLPLPSREAFEAAMLSLRGVRGTFDGQGERPASFRFYDLNALRGAFGEAAVIRESGALHAKKRRWVQQLMVERRPLPRTSGMQQGAGKARCGLVLTVWPCEAVWRDRAAQWAMGEQPPFTVTLLA
jgi:hypothetical protein